MLASRVPTRTDTPPSKMAARSSVMSIAMRGHYRPPRPTPSPRLRKSPDPKKTVFGTLPIAPPHARGWENPMLKKTLKLTLAAAVAVPTVLALYVEFDGVPRYASPPVDVRTAKV